MAVAVVLGSISKVSPGTSLPSSCPLDLEGRESGKSTSIQHIVRYPSVCVCVCKRLVTAKKLLTRLPNTIDSM